jgi:two-component system response regulator (stage 0 sporulation protein A)
MKLVSLQQEQSQSNQSQKANDYLHSAVSVSVQNRNQSETYSVSAFAPHPRVLIADNDMATAIELAAELKKNGMEIVAVSCDGQEAVEILIEQSPDVLITDLILPQRDGYDLIKIAAQMPRKTLSIVHTTLTSNYAVNRAVECGADNFIVRPALTENIVAAIKEGLNGVPAPTVDNIDNTELNNLVTKAIMQLGVPAHIIGFRYMRDMICRCVKNENESHMITKVLYPETAKQYQTTSTRVERAVRHAIEVAWCRGNAETVQSYFENTIDRQKGKPTNGEFIAMLADKIRREINGAGKNQLTVNFKAVA